MKQVRRWAWTCLWAVAAQGAQGAFAGALALWAGGSTAAAEPAQISAMQDAVCSVLRDQSGPDALVAAAEGAGWTVEAALETADCRYVFIDAGAPSPAGHHIVARWGNYQLIPWLATRAIARGDPGGPRRIFERRGRDGDATDYATAMIDKFGAGDPAVADLFRWARREVRIASAPEPPRYHAE